MNVPGTLFVKHDSEKKAVAILISEPEFKMLATAIKYYKNHIECNRRHYAKKRGVDISEVRERNHDFYKLLEFAEQMRYE